MVVSDTTPLSAFLRIGRIDLLFTLFSEIHIPEAVAAELDRGLSVIGDWRRHQAHIHVHKIEIPPALQEVLSNIDPGEAEAIALALRERAELLLVDDGDGRDAARRLNVPILGSAGVVVRAKRKGYVPLIGPMLQDLRVRGGLWLSEQFVIELQARNGEG